MAATNPNPAQAIPEHRLICRVCEKQYSKYMCPQCNLRYCSLACYKNHSLRCTESFMRNKVMAEMRDIQATKESQEIMKAALKRIHFDEAGRTIFEDEFADESVDNDDLDDRHGTILSDKSLKLIAEGGDLSLDDLALEERKAFLRAVAAGEVSHLIKPWDPWWLNPNARSVSITVHGTSLVQSVYPSKEQITEGPRTSASETTPSTVPTPPSEALAQVRQLVHADPSPLLSILLAEVVYSYCFTLRFCNGDWQSEPSEAAMILLSVSQVLSQAASPESIGVAFSEAVKAICSPTFKHAGGFKFAVALFDDSAAVLGLGRACVVCALADLHRMLESAKRNLKAESEAEKNERVEHELRGNHPLSLNGNSTYCSTVKEKLSAESCATQNLSSKGAREKDIQRNTYADLRKMRDNKRDLDRKRRPLSAKEGKTRTGLNGSLTSSRSAASGHHQKQKGSSIELRKITAASRKVYFLMCWANEQPSEVLLSLALLVDAEKNRLLETGATKNIGLQMMQEVKAPINRHRPIIREIMEKQQLGENSGKQG